MSTNDTKLIAPELAVSLARNGRLSTHTGNEAKRVVEAAQKFADFLEGDSSVSEPTGGLPTEEKSEPGTDGFNVEVVNLSNLRLEDIPDAIRDLIVGFKEDYDGGL